MIRSFSLNERTVRAVGNAIKVVGEPERPATPPPALGADTDAVLRSLLGYDDDRIAGLETMGVFGGTQLTGSQGPR